MRDRTRILAATETFAANAGIFFPLPISKQEGKLNVQVRVTLALDALHSYLRRRRHRVFCSPEAAPLLNERQPNHG